MPQGYETFFMLNSTEHELWLGHKNKIPTIKTFFMLNPAEYEISLDHKYEYTSN